MWETPETPFPANSAEDIERLQSRQKRLAVERAKSSKFFAGQLDHVNLDRLDDADEWRKIPILTKEQLRGLAPDRFFDDFCIGNRTDVVEYWRSGGATGRHGLAGVVVEIGAWAGFGSKTPHTKHFLPDFSDEETDHRYYFLTAEKT